MRRLGIPLALGLMSMVHAACKVAPSQLQDMSTSSGLSVGLDAGAHAALVKEARLSLQPDAQQASPLLLRANVTANGTNLWMEFDQSLTATPIAEGAPVRIATLSLLGADSREIFTGERRDFSFHADQLHFVVRCVEATICGKAIYQPVRFDQRLEAQASEPPQNETPASGVNVDPLKDPLTNSSGELWPWPQETTGSPSTTQAQMPADAATPPSPQNGTDTTDGQQNGLPSGDGTSSGEPTYNPWGF